MVDPTHSFINQRRVRKTVAGMKAESISIHEAVETITKPHSTARSVAKWEDKSYWAAASRVELSEWAGTREEKMQLCINIYSEWAINAWKKDVILCMGSGRVRSEEIRCSSSSSPFGIRWLLCCLFHTPVWAPLLQVVGAARSWFHPPPSHAGTNIIPLLAAVVVSHQSKQLHFDCSKYFLVSTRLMLRLRLSRNGSFVIMFFCSSQRS